MAIVVVNEAQFAIVVFAAPLDGLGDVAGGGDLAEGGVGVGGADVAAGAEDFADVFVLVVGVAIPSAVLLNGEGTGGNGLGWIPHDVPKSGMGGAGEIYAGDLQVAAVDVALVQGDVAADGDLFHEAATHIVVAAFNDGLFAFAGEFDRAVVGVVNNGPNAAAGFQQGLVAVGVELRFEGTAAIGGNLGVLVEFVSAVGDFFRDFFGRFAVVVVVVGKVIAAEAASGEFVTVVVGEAIVFHRALAGGAAGAETSQSIVSEVALDHVGGAVFVAHAGEEVAFDFVALGQVHAMGHGQGCLSNSFSLTPKDHFSEAGSEEATFRKGLFEDGAMERQVIVESESL
jgi:hypothetical protein